MFKRIIITIWVCLALDTYAQVSAPSAAPSISSFNLEPDNLGVAQHSVNLFTGDLNLPIKLVSLSGKEGLDVNVTISYNSNLQSEVDTWNLDKPAGILGLGWNMDNPKIICDHKQTGTREDDTYYLVEGGASMLLIRTGSGTDATGSFSTYQVKKYQFWQIKFYYDPADYGLGGTGSNKWVIIKENGFKYVYGDKNSGRSTIMYSVRWKNWIGNSSNITNQSQLATAWNLSEVDNIWGEKVTYEYTNIEQYVGSALGQKHTEASYLKQIVDPIGRKVQFFYNNKSMYAYMEPHTEQPEPDAYQENYEKLYLDHINVLQETGVLYLSVNLNYTTINDGTSTAKMLLSYIEQRNGANEVHPGIQLSYYNSTTSSGYKGFLQKVTYPSGGTVTYSYAMSNNTIGHSNRTNLNITAPPADVYGPDGYAEPYVWFGPDYAVVTWRAVGKGIVASSDNKTQFNHATGPMAVKLSVYQWVGEWVKQDLITIPNVSANFSTNGQEILAAHYTDFQVVTEQDFFAVLTKSRDTHYDFSIFLKSESSRGNWSRSNYQSLNFGTTGAMLGVGNRSVSPSPSLISEKEFILIGSFFNSTQYPSHLYTFTGNGFTETTFTGTPNGASAYNYFTSGVNYFINFTDATFTFPSGFSPTQISLNYLTEEKKWGQSVIPSTSSLAYRGWNGDYYQSYWYGSNSFAVAIAGGNPEYIYRWDINYSNFIRDNGAGSLLGTWDDNSFVYGVNNSLVGIVDSQVKGKALRFDGNTWILSNDHKCPPYITGTTGGGGPQYVGFGFDFLVSVDNNAGSRSLAIFDPNTDNWTEAPVHVGNSRMAPFASSNLFIDNGELFGFYRMPDGTWKTIGSGVNGGPPVAGVVMKDCILATDFNLSRTLRNGDVDAMQPVGTKYSSYTDYDQFGTRLDRWLYGNTIYANYVPSSSVTNTFYLNAQALNLYYDAEGILTGNQIDYPVSLITISGSDAIDQTIAFEYNFSTATVDPSGATAEYADVNVIMGSDASFAKPNGYTKTYFNNGIDNAADPNIPSIPGLSMNLLWIGQPYQVKVFDANGNVVSSSTTYFTIFDKPIYNSSNTQVNLGHYVKPSSTTQISDGVTSTTSYLYDQNSGQVRSSTIANSASSITQEVTYWYEKYDALKSMNLLTPVVQASKNLK